MRSSLYVTLMSGGTAFDPASLFAKYGASGFYLPFSKDPTRSLGGGLLVPMYQHQAGTPVDADGESIGLAIDESQGAAVGADVVTNGGFDADSDWTKGGSWSIGSGVASAGGSSGSLTQGVTLAANTWYRIDYTVTSVSSGNVKAQFQGGTASVGTLHSVAGAYTDYLFNADNTTLAMVAGGTTPDAAIDNVSVKPIAGNHALQTTASAKPTFKAGSPNYGSFDGGDYLDVGLATALTEVTVAACFRGTAATDIALGRATTGGDVFLGINPSGYLGGGWRTQSWTTIDDDNARDITGEDVVGLLRANASTVQLWLDGVKVYEGAPSGTAIAADNGWYVGAHNNEGTAAFHLAGRLYQPFMIESYIDDADVVPLMRALGAGVVSI